MNVATPKPVPAAAIPVSVPEPAPMARPSLAARLRPAMETVLPPLLVVLALLGVWELVAGGATATLPPPSTDPALIVLT